MRNHYDIDRFEHCVGEGLHLLRCASHFARQSHLLRAADRGSTAERERARVYRHKARKALNAARQFLPH